MRSIIEKFVQYPIYANLIIAVFIVAGGVSLMSMKKSFFPEVESRIIGISVFYPGASPVEMEEGVTSRIEEAIRGLIGIKEINSSSSENSARITIETTGEYPIDEVLMEVKNAVDGVSSLPSAAERPIVSKSRSRAPALRMDVVPEEGVVMDLMTLKEYAQRVEEDFYSSGVMSQIDLSGYPQPEISVEVNEEQLLRYNLSFEDISAAIQQNNQDVSAGEIKSDDEELLIRLRSRSTNPDKIGNIILFAQKDGSYIRIRDIAEVKKKFADSVNKSWVNGRESVSIEVEKLPSEDLEEITDFALDYIEKFNTAGNGVRLEMSRAYIEILDSRLELLAKNGLVGLTLIIIGLSLFLSVRLSLWVSFGIPFSFLGMFMAASAMGITINMMSLFGMILVIGILVDDGIVIAENIYLHFEQGKRPMLAAVDGTMEVLPAVITSVTTTIVAFVPLLFLSGTRMEMMLQMAVVVILALVFSLFEAFFVLPAHLSNPKVLSRRSLETKNKGIKKYFDRGMVWLRENIYHHMLIWLIKWRHAVIGIPVGLILITLGLVIGGHIKNTFFPSVDFDRFEVNIAFTPGDGEAQTLRYLKKFETAIWEVNSDLIKEFDMDEDMISRVSTNLGSARAIQESGSHAGSIGVYPIDLEGYEITGFDIANRVREKIGPVPEALKFTVGGRNRWGSPISVGLMSKNLGELDEAKYYLMERLRELPALKDITESLALGKQEVRLELKPKAYFLNLDENTIARQVRSGFYGLQAQRLQEGRDELRVWVRYPKDNRMTLGQMEKMKIKTSQGEFPLNELATYHFERGPVAINRFNGAREIRVEAETIDPYAPIPEIIDQIETEIMPEITALFPGIRYIYQGQTRYSQEALVKVKKYFLIAFLIIIFIMIIHFRSIDQPLIIIAMIPLSMLGVFWGHGIHDKPLSLMSLWGMVALTGVIINDAIVFLAKYDGLLLEGRKVVDAVVEAGKVRLRPIILTSLTTSIGLFPIILQKSVQAQFLIPMAISLAYGVAIGTIFILIFFPVLIMLLNDFRVFRRKLWTGIKPEREAVETIIILEKRKNRFEHGPTPEELKEEENE
ncbi:MAG: efflux RND transporter permease subunit [Bacteroidales bacterium]|nr:efflux RND transporter permease subunit [Bacteroidales bacterium]MCF8389263.1 efflux RND transporter permease subunit [Bacteroidales bacterium]